MEPGVSLSIRARSQRSTLPARYFGWICRQPGRDRRLKAAVLKGLSAYCKWLIRKIRNCYAIQMVNMKLFLPAVLVMLLASCSSTPAGGRMIQLKNSTRTTLPDLGPAPELTNTVWLNADAPLRLADLRGKVVALEMWTFDCINCQHVTPSLEDWYARYKGQGLVIIGNHFPEFAHERDLGNLRQAVARAGIEYPVAQDNDGATWSAYASRYWPTLYLIDKRGRVRYVHIGEGAYAEIEQNIKALLAENFE